MIFSLHEGFIPTPRMWTFVDLECGVDQASPYLCTLNSSIVPFIPVKWWLNFSNPQPQIKFHKFFKDRCAKFEVYPFVILFSSGSWFLRFQKFLDSTLMFSKIFIYLALLFQWVSCSVASCPTNTGGTYPQWIWEKLQLSFPSNFSGMFKQVWDG